MPEGPPFAGNDDPQSDALHDAPLRTYAGKKLNSKQRQRRRVYLQQKNIDTHNLDPTDHTMEGEKKVRDQADPEELNRVETEHEPVSSGDAGGLTPETAPDPSPYVVEMSHDYNESDAGDMVKAPYQPDQYRTGSLSSHEVGAGEQHPLVSDEVSQQEPTPAEVPNEQPSQIEGEKNVEGEETEVPDNSSVSEKAPENTLEDLTLVPKDVEDAREQTDTITEPVVKLQDPETDAQSAVAIDAGERSGEMGESVEGLFASEDTDAMNELIGTLAEARAEGKEHDLYSRIMGAWSGEAPGILKDKRPMLRQRFGIGRGKPYQKVTQAVQDMFMFLEREAQGALRSIKGNETGRDVKDIPANTTAGVEKETILAADPNDESTLRVMPMDATLEERPVYEKGDPDDPSTWKTIPVDAKLKEPEVYNKGDVDDPSTWEAIPVDAKIVPSEKKSDAEAEPGTPTETIEKAQEEAPQEEAVAAPTPESSEATEQAEPTDPEALKRFHEARDAYRNNKRLLFEAEQELQQAIQATREEATKTGVFMGRYITGSLKEKEVQVKECEERYMQLLSNVKQLRNERVAAFQEMRIRNADRAVSRNGQEVTVGERLNARIASWYEAVREKAATQHLERMNMMSVKENVRSESTQGRFKSFFDARREQWRQMPPAKRALWGGLIAGAVAGGAGALMGAALTTAAVGGGITGTRRFVGMAVGGTVGAGLGVAAQQALEKRNERLTTEAIEEQQQNARTGFSTEEEMDLSDYIKKRKKIDKRRRLRSGAAKGAMVGVAASTGIVAGVGAGAAAESAMDTLAQRLPSTPSAPRGNGLVFESPPVSPEAYMDPPPAPPGDVPTIEAPGTPPQTPPQGRGSLFESRPIDPNAISDPETPVTPEVTVDESSTETTFGDEQEVEESSHDDPLEGAEEGENRTEVTETEEEPAHVEAPSIVVEIQPGGNVWNSIAGKLESSGLIETKDQIATLKESGGDWEEALAHRNHLIDELKDHFAGMSQDELREIGFRADRNGEYNINRVWPGDKLDLTKILGDHEKFTAAVTNADNVGLRPAATSGIELGSGPSTAPTVEPIPTGSQTPAPPEWTTQGDELQNLFDQYLNHGQNTGGAEDAVTASTPDTPRAPEGFSLDAEALPDTDGAVTGAHPDLHPGAEPTPTYEDIVGTSGGAADLRSQLRSAVEAAPTPSTEPAAAVTLEIAVPEESREVTQTEGAVDTSNPDDSSGASTPETTGDTSVAESEREGAESSVRASDFSPEQRITNNLEDLASVDYRGINTLNDFRAVWSELRAGLDGTPLLNTPLLGRYVELQSSWGPMSHVRLGDLYDNVDGATFTIDGTTHTLVPETELMLRSVIEATKKLPGAEGVYDHAIQEGHSVGEYIKKLHEARVAQ